MFKLIPSFLEMSEPVFCKIHPDIITGNHSSLGKFSSYGCGECGTRKPRFQKTPDSRLNEVVERNNAECANFNEFH